MGKKKVEEIKNANAGKKELVKKDIYEKIFKILVNIPDFKTENINQLENNEMKQRFYLFSFFLISCKHELAKYLYEQEKVPVVLIKFSFFDFKI